MSQRRIDAGATRVQFRTMPTHKDQSGNDIPALVTYVTNPFTVPAIGSEVSVWLDSKEGISKGQQVFIPDIARFRVSMLPLVGNQVRLVTLSMEGDSVPGVSVPAGAVVSSAATPPGLSPAVGPTPVLVTAVTLSFGAVDLVNANFTTNAVVNLTNCDVPVGGDYGTLTYTPAAGKITVKSQQGLAANKVIVTVWSW